MPFAHAREAMIILGDIFWDLVNSCRSYCLLSCRVGGAAVALIIVGLDALHSYYTHIRPAVTGPLILPLSLVERTSHEEESWVGQLAVKQ